MGCKYHFTVSVDHLFMQRYPHVTDRKITFILPLLLFISAKRAYILFCARVKICKKKGWKNL